jgi:hypothetical protein
LERFESLNNALHQIVGLGDRSPGGFKGCGVLRQLVPDSPDIRLHPIPRFRRLLAEGADILFQSAEPVRNGGQALLESCETRGQRLEIRIEARSNWVAHGLNLLFGSG